MPTTNARGHTIPLGTEASFNRTTIFNSFGNSIRDVVPVANTTARTQLITNLTNAGQGPTAARPVYVYRADAPRMHGIECTINGTVWTPASGVLSFASKGDADSWATSNGSYLTTGDLCRVGVREYRWSGSAWRATRPLFLARRGGTQTFGQPGWYGIGSAFGTGNPDINDIGSWVPANGTLQVTHAGIYRVGLNVRLQNASSPMAIQVTQNSSSADAGVVAESFVNAQATTLSTSGLAVLASNDVIRGLVYTSVANNIDTTETRGLQLSVELIQYT